MKNLQFEFTIDKSSQIVFIQKEFEADLNLVWNAFTTKELLDQWWAPKPWLSKTKNMDFKVGGSRFYAMVGPEGEEHLAIQQFTAIQPKSNFKYSNAFADENATPNLPGSEWNLNFRAENGITTVTISIYNDSLERMEQMLEMGFKEGFTMTLNELDHLLLATKKS